MVFDWLVAKRIKEFSIFLVFCTVLSPVLQVGELLRLTLSTEILIFAYHCLFLTFLIPSIV